MARTTTATLPRRGPGSRARLQLILGRAGISEDRFLEVAARALEELRGGGVSVQDPATQFSETERAALGAGGLDLSKRRSREPDPIAETAARYTAMLADSADVAEVAGLLGVTRTRVRQRAQERSLLAVREADEWRFPRAQFEGGAPVRGFPAVSMALPADLHPVAAWSFLNEPNADLELLDRPTSPLDWLRSGGSPDPVAAIAREL